MKRETRLRGRSQYHINWCPPNGVWPKGGWSLYRITGDEIAERIEWGKPAKGYKTIGRKVVRRDPWCGYIGMFETFSEREKAIDTDAAEVVTFVSYDNDA
jgi:hypothetical protein